MGGNRFPCRGLEAPQSALQGIVYSVASYTAREIHLANARAEHHRLVAADQATDRLRCRFVVVAVDDLGNPRVG